tara:strand:+ start:145 stop:1203 length:1059 start_codon:yes stop_codon:yes gene_type:complete
MRNFFKIIFINFVVFFSLFLCLEILSRAYLISKSCMRSVCQWEYASMNVLTENPAIQFVAPHPKLGYVNTAGFNSIVKTDGWDNVRVTIDENGYRENDNFELDFDDKSYLMIGGGLVFGNKVGNNQTVPACLERNLGSKVYNAGVSLYAPSQSILKLLLNEKRLNYDAILWSILVENDFSIDQKSIVANLSKPVVTNIGGELKYEFPSQIELPNRDLRYFLGYSVILKRFILPLFQEKDFVYDGVYELQHSNAADPYEILDFIMSDFKKIPANVNKYIILQYNSAIFYNKAFLQIKATKENIIKYVNKHDIRIIDTFDAVYKKEQRFKLWDGYHTAYGNEVVCNYVYNKLKE